jgi:heterotetrameric sarcosine oxidase gamma subunit
MPDLLEQCAQVRVQSWSIPKDPPPVGALLQETWPLNTGTVARGEVEVLCLGPTEWLVSTPDPGEAPALVQRLSSMFADTSFRATDMSSALARFRIAGPNSRALLSKGTGLDLRPNAFRPNRCTRTRLAEIPVVIRCADEFVFECTVTVSCKDYLFQWLVDADFEFGIARAMTVDAGPV